MKTLTAGAVALWIGMSPAQAEVPFYQVIADCTGRLSAEMEHAWLKSDPAADALEAQRHSFVSILEATMPEDAGPAVLNRRVETKLAHERLLNTAAFGVDPVRAAWAEQRSTLFLRNCQNLLLGG